MFTKDFFYKSLIFSVIALLTAIALFQFFQPEKVKAAVINTSQTFSIENNETSLSRDSEIYTADFEFNAIAPSWKNLNADENNRQFFIKTSLDNITWTDWIEVDAIQMQKDGINDDRLYPEVPIFQTGKYFQYRVNLQRISASVQTPEINNIKINYIDSRPSLKQKFGELLSSVFTAHADSTPTIVSRSGWGSIDPNGDYYKNDPAHYWPPVNVPVNQIFVHHTVDSNTSTNFASIVRAIWEYHAVTLAWGDIGYNYLIDPNGVIYEGRFGGDGVIAGHTLNYNTHSMGVALIGCYQSNNSTCQQLNNNNVTSPSNTMIDSLTTLLAYKMKSYELDPTSTDSFCDYNNSNCLNLNMIAGHRDAYATACPGDLTYNILNTIRSTVASKKSSMDWSYSSKQIDFPNVAIGYLSESTVTMHFKNTGTATWSKTGSNRMLLKTANPLNHASLFQSDTWLDSSTAAVLNETTVAPGETGSFTVKFASYVHPQGEYREYFQLVSENNWTFKNYYSVPVSLVYVSPTPTPTLIPTPFSTPTITQSPGISETPIISTTTPAPTPIINKDKGDLNLNNVVDLSDLSILAANYGKTTSSGDVNGDGKVDLSDLSILAANWGKSF